MKSFSMYISTSGHPIIGQKKQCTYSDHQKTKRLTTAFPSVKFDLTYIWTNSHADVLRLDHHTTFNIKTQTYGIKHNYTSTDTHKHVYTYLLKKTLSMIPNSVPLLSAPDVGRTRFNKNKITRNNSKLKTHPYSGLLYTIFTHKTHTHTPFKNSITDYQFRTFYSITFNPTSISHKLLPKDGTWFHVPVCPYFYFVKMIKPRSTLIQLWLHNKTNSCLII